MKERYPADNILLYFTDTLWENEDSYRFINESSDKLELPLLTHSIGINPIQLMFEKKIMYNSRMADCSKYLKMRVAADYLKKNKIPKIQTWRNKASLKNLDFITNATVYFGIGIEELHREGPIVENWKPFKVRMPLIEESIDIRKSLKTYNIKQPELYDLEFSHNNCNGRCVKAGQGHYRNLKRKMPEVYKKLMEQEYHLSMCVSSYRYIIYGNSPKDTIHPDDIIPLDVQERELQELDDAYRDYFYDRAERPKLYIHPAASSVNMEMRMYSFMKKANPEFVSPLYDDTGALFLESGMARSIPYSLYQFHIDEQKKPYQLDLFDIGGCGCFIQ